MTLPFTAQQCFFVVIVIFIVLGFLRGWRRELVTLVFVLLAVFLVRPDSINIVSDFLSRLPSTFGYLTTGNTTQSASTSMATGSMAPFWSLLLFFGVIALGYFVGSKAFPVKPSTPHERFIGIVPAVVSGAFVIYYLTNYFPKATSGQSVFTVAVQSPDPAGYLPVIFVIAVIAAVIGLIVSKAKKTAPKK